MKRLFFPPCFRGRQFRGCVFGVAGLFWVLGSFSLSGAELVINYDLSTPGAWQEGRLQDSLGHAPAQIPLSVVSPEEFDVLAKIEGFDPAITGPEDFGPPEFVAGKGAGGRSYLSFEKLGGLVVDAAELAAVKFEGTSGAILNTGNEAKGYTMEMLVRIQPDYRSTCGLAIGGGGETSLENVLLGLSGKKAVTTTTVMGPDGGAVTNENLENFQVTTPLPFDGLAGGAWIHLVKVHDPASKSMTYYLDGQQITEADLSGLPDPGVYPSREEYQTLVGAKTRRVSGVDFSFYRAYRGAMTAAEVNALYAASQKGP